MDECPHIPPLGLIWGLFFRHRSLHNNRIICFFAEKYLLRSYFHNKAESYGIVRMALFGSVARNEQTGQSDIDIAYEGEANLLLRSRMKQELEELFGCRVDLIRLRKQLADTAFLRNISKDLLYV